MDPQSRSFVGEGRSPSVQTEVWFRGNHSSDSLNDSIQTLESGTSIYEDAPAEAVADQPHQGYNPGYTQTSLSEDGEEAGTNYLRHYLSSPRSSHSQGLQSVTPIRSQHRLSDFTPLTSRASLVYGATASHRNESDFDFGLPNTADLGTTSSYAQSPTTPRVRASPRREPPRPPPPPPPSLMSLPGIESAKRGKHPPGKRSRHPSSSSGTDPLRSLSTSSTSSKDSRGFLLAFGRPRTSSAHHSAASIGGLSGGAGSGHNGSRGTSHASIGSSGVSSDGHIEPQKVVNGNPYSYIRRPGPSAYPKRQFLAGIPKLPYFPNPREPDSEFAIDGRDSWGRREASVLTSILALVLCTFFPPLWLLLCGGYFDAALGPIPRVFKLIALGLAMLTLAAASTLVIVFSIVKL